MNVNWIPLLAGLALGLIPPRLLINCECRYLIFEDLWNKIIKPAQPTARRRRWWKLPLVWIDPIRGYVVATFLMEAFKPERGAKAIEHVIALALSGLLLLAALWTQTHGRRDERESLSPAGFLAGMMVGLLPLPVLIAALVMGAAGALAMQSYAGGYIAATLTTALVGFAFMGKSQKLALVVSLVAFPLIANWLRGTRMVTPVRY